MTDIKHKSDVNKSLNKLMNSYDPNIARVFIPWALKNPRYIRSFIRLKKNHIIAKQLREKELENGIKVPPFLILSITPYCNLKCSGCYAVAAGTTRLVKNLNITQWKKIIREASELGVFGFVIAGGEPFLYPELLDICKEFKDHFFIILTNGTLLEKKDYKNLKKLGNIAILISIEGDRELTNKRRGEGVYENAMNAVKHLNKYGVLNGISVTITRLNYTYWMNPKYIDELISNGIKISVFIEYIPLTPIQDINLPTRCMHSNIFSSKNLVEWDTQNDHKLMLNPSERKKFRKYILNLRKTKQFYVVHSPGDEEFFGGCVSAGRGFAHITPKGDLTPCPVSNIATHNLINVTLREALASPLFKIIRESDHLLETDGMPCALFAHPKEVEKIAKSVGAYRTDGD